MPTPFRSIISDHSEGADSHALFFAGAVIASIALHSLFAWAARDSRIGLIREPSDQATERDWHRDIPEPSARFHIEDVFKPAKEKDRRDFSQFSAQERLTAPERAVEQALDAVPSSSPETYFDPPPLDRAVDPAVVGIAQPARVSDPEPVEPWVPRERILQIDSRFANEKFAASSRRLVPKIERTMAVSDIVPPSRIGAMAESASKRGLPAYVPPPPPQVEISVPDTPEAEVRKAPERIDVKPVVKQREAQVFICKVSDDAVPVKPIESVLKADLKTFRPKKDDGFIYFQIEISRKSGDVLPPIKRDIILVQDASHSIHDGYLKNSCKALGDILSTLGPGDRFNVLSFNTQTRFFVPGGWAEPTPENIAAARAFLSQIKPEGNTDIFNAAKAILQLPRDPARATLAVLSSDGRSTAGDVQRDSQIIGDFAKLNDGSVSVFDIGISRRKNEYLLSMLSFCNRGGPAAIVDSFYDADKVFSALSSTIGAPVLQDLRFQFSTDAHATVVPEMTENLYLDRPLRLYGRVPLGTQDVTFEALGQNGGNPYDMVFELPLGAPQRGSGDAEIAAAWAKTRIYDLVAEWSRNRDRNTLLEMERIGISYRQYGVELPFSKDFLRR